jgi:hypothetical protein
MGNDFFDTFQMAKRHPVLMESIAPVLKAAADALERRQPLEEEIIRLYELGETKERPRRTAFRRWFSEHSKVYGLLRTVRSVVTPPQASPLLSRDFATAVAGLTPVQRQHTSIADGRQWRTILTVPYRGRALDDRDARIRLGFEVARHAVLTIAARCRAAGVGVLVVLFPTKESVFWPHIATPDTHKGLSQLVQDEERLAREWTTELGAQGVDYLDLLPVLRSATSQPFYEDVDGHLNAVGHRLVAGAVVGQLARR